eukprot:365434_1
MATDNEKKSRKRKRSTSSESYQSINPSNSNSNNNNDDSKQIENCMDITKLNIIEYKLKDNATVLYCKKFLNQTRRKELFDELMLLNYEQGEFKLFGKPVKTPRLQCWMRDNNISNKEANLYQKQKGYNWSNNMLYVKNSIEKLVKCKFDYVLINYYRDGSDYIGWHADKEARLKCRNVIGSVSLGGPRKFMLRHIEWKKNKEPKKEFLLQSGCLIVMKDDTQKQWKHTVPKTKKPQNPRINLTFRQSGKGCHCNVCSKK